MRKSRRERRKWQRRRRKKKKVAVGSYLQTTLGRPSEDGIDPEETEQELDLGEFIGALG